MLKGMIWESFQTGVNRTSPADSESLDDSTVSVSTITQIDHT